MHQLFIFRFTRLVELLAIWPDSLYNESCDKQKYLSCYHAKVNTFYFYCWKRFFLFCPTIAFLVTANFRLSHNPIYCFRTLRTQSLALFIALCVTRTKRTPLTSPWYLLILKCINVKDGYYELPYLSLSELISSPSFDVQCVV